MMTPEQYKLYRREKTKEGKEFEDYVETILRFVFKIQIGVYQTMEEQYDIGESEAGIEIKRDQRFRETGNLYIECDEKAEPREGPFWPSGIYRDSRDWLYIIGDTDLFFAFGKRQLQALYTINQVLPGGRWPVVLNGMETGHGFLLPVEEAWHHALFAVRQGSLVARPPIRPETHRKQLEKLAGG